MLSGKNWCKDASVGGLKGLNRRRPQLMELFFSLSLSPVGRFPQSRPALKVSAQALW